MSAITREAWSRQHAALLLSLTALAGFYARDNNVPLVLWLSVTAAAASFARLLRINRGSWTASGRFGPANAVTLVRCLGWCALPAARDTPAGLLLGVCVTLFGLDALDGWLARRYQCASAAGAHFDMETDAWSVLVLCGLLVSRGDAPGFVIGAGILRYAFVWLRHALGHAGFLFDVGETRGQLGRVIYVAAMILLLTCLLVPGQSVPAGLACALLGASFTRELCFLRRQPAPGPPV